MNDQTVLATDRRQFLTFALGQEAYGVEILQVQEIKGVSAITPIPHTPPHVKGILDLRGRVIPIVELRVKFGLGAPASDQLAVIMIVHVGARKVELVVDAVSDVLDLPGSEIQPVPDLGAHVDVRFITGVARANDQLVLLLDLERVLCDEELAAVEAVHTPQGGLPLEQLPH